MWYTLLYTPTILSSLPNGHGKGGFPMHDKLIRQIDREIAEALAARRLIPLPNRKAALALLKDPDWQAGLSALFPIRERLTCAGVLELCAPLMARLCPDAPEQGWGPFCYQYICRLMFPDNGAVQPDRPDAGRTAAPGGGRAPHRLRLRGSVRRGRRAQRCHGGMAAPALGLLRGQPADRGGRRTLRQHPGWRGDPRAAHALHGREPPHLRRPAAASPADSPRGGSRPGITYGQTKAVSLSLHAIRPFCIKPTKVCIGDGYIAVTGGIQTAASRALQVMGAGLSRCRVDDPASMDPLPPLLETLHPA